MNKITLTINKDKVDFYFGLGFLGKALKEIDLGIDELGENLSKNPFLYAPKLMFYSMEYGYIRNGKDFDLSYFEFLDLLDKDNTFSNGNLAKFLESFTKSLTRDTPKQDKDTSKKK